MHSSSEKLIYIFVKINFINTITFVFKRTWKMSYFDTDNYLKLIIPDVNKRNNDL